MGYYNNESLSRGEYFSWINNTNEGSTEKQTLINLEYFKFMRRRFGLELDIYAFDAGNLDGASGTYGSMENPRFRENFPQGFGTVAKAAEEAGMRMGLWAGADGFGDTPEEEKARKEIFISLCRDLNFALFKFDTVCGELRREKQAAFVDMLRECRKYAPDLIVLNHRNQLEKAADAATTFLWQGSETYIDVHAFNEICAPHHRVSALLRGYPPENERICEDHGVCLSSCMDYWQDELVVHLFSRCLLLAPQLYGNPWLLKDEEQAQLGYLCALHRKYRQALIHQYPMEGLDCCRGDENVRFIVLVNPAWIERKVTLSRADIALPKGNWQARIEHPFIRHLGEMGDTISCTVPPFRSLLLRLERTISFPAPRGVDARPLEFIGNETEFSLFGEGKKEYSLSLSGDLSSYKEAWLDGKPAPALLEGKCISWIAPGESGKAGSFLGELAPCPVPENAEALYEAAMFAADNEALEVRTLKRSGETAFPEVQAARDAFFGQDTFVYRGESCQFAFDGREDTFFCAATQDWDQRIQGGCLRIDLGEARTEVDIDFLMEEKESLPFAADGSADLNAFIPAEISAPWQKDIMEFNFVPKIVPIIEKRKAFRQICRLTFEKPVRYIRLQGAPIRVISVKAVHLNNLFAPYHAPACAWQGEITLEHYPEGSYLCVALDGEHGQEGAYAALSVGNQLIGPCDRAPSYPCDPFEHYVRARSHHYTYYFPLKDLPEGEKIGVHVLGMPWGKAEFTPKVYVSLPEAPVHHGKLRLKK